jgi:hypothetical protein
VLLQQQEMKKAEAELMASGERKKGLKAFEDAKFCKWLNTLGNCLSYGNADERLQLFNSVRKLKSSPINVCSVSLFFTDEKVRLVLNDLYLYEYVFV